MRAFLVVLAASAAALTASCATEYDQSIADAALAACEAQGLPAGPVMSDCISQTSENIRAARSYRPETPRNPPPPSNR